MKEYKCPRCGYNTNKKCNMETHINRKKRCTMVKEEKELVIEDTVKEVKVEKINSYNETTYDFLKDNDYVYCVNRVILCIPHLIKKIHFNENHPENRNMYLSNLRNKYMTMLEDDIWKVKSLDETLNRIISDYDIILEEWVGTYKDKTIVDKFGKYNTIKKDEEVIKTIKEEIKLLLYNNRL